MNSARTAFFIAYKSITRGSKSTSVLLVFILSLSFLNMMFISGILSGLQQMFSKVMIDNFTSHITIEPQKEPQIKEFISDQNEIRTQIEAIPGVIATARRYSLAGSLIFDRDKNGVFKNVSGVIYGIDPTQTKKIFTIDKLIIRGEFLSDSDTDQIVLSSAIAGGYGVPAASDLGGVKAGDKIRITYANGVMRNYTVKGIYDDTLGLYITFISAKEAESVLSVYNSASQILVKTDLDARSINKYEERIKTLVPRLEVKNYTSFLAAAGAFINALDLISFIVSAISVLVAAVTIFVLIYVNAINKRRQIGILKAIGIEKKIIVLSYVFQSFFYAFFGIAIGSLLVFAVLTPLLIAHPINVGFGGLSLAHSLVAIISGIISLLLAGLLAGYVPARLVAKEDILKAIWG